MAKYYDTYAEFKDENGKPFEVTDEAVAEYTKKHMRLRDRRDIRKVTECVMLSFSILSKSIDPPVGDDWYYYDDLRGKNDLWSDT